MRVAAYARVSTDKEDQINSLESQKSYFAQYIKAHEGWSLTNVYYDEAVSGTQAEKRAGFKAMIDAALKGEIDLILTKEVCRFARNTVDTLFYTRKLKEAEVGVIFTIDNINTMDSDGELRLTIMACIAQEESRKTSERVKWGQKRRMEQGVVFGRDMLGYTVKNGIMTVNDSEAPIVRAIFHKYANEDKGTHTIAKELLAEGMYPKNARVWSSSVILRVLKNEKYVGDLCQKKTITPDFLTHARKCNLGEEEKIYLSNHHEAIIDRQLWNRTQEKLKIRSKVVKQTAKTWHCEENGKGRYWCSGKIYCAECGNSFVSRIKKRKDGSIYRAWRCYAAACGGAAKTDERGIVRGCNNISINEKSLLRCVHYAIGMIPIDLEKLKNEILEDIDKVVTAPSAKESQKLFNDIERLRYKKEKAVDLMLENLISRKDLDRQLRRYDDEITILTEKLDKILNTDIRDRCSAAIDEIMDFSENAGKDNCSNGYSVCREVLEKVRIHEGSLIEIKFKCIPFGIKIKFRSGGKMEKFHTEILYSELYNFSCDYW